MKPESTALRAALPSGLRAHDPRADAAFALVLTALVGLSGCVLVPVPEHTMAGILRLNEERVALLSAVQPRSPSDTDPDADPDARFLFNVQCTDGTQVVVVSSTLDARGEGLFEIVLPPGDAASPWTCSFSAPGESSQDVGGVPTTIDSTYALGALRDCDVGAEALLFSWDGASRWLDVVEADGINVCAHSDASDVSASALSYAFDVTNLDGQIWCGSVTIRQSIGRASEGAVGWSPILCHRLVTSPLEGDLVHAAIYRGIEQGTALSGCPLLPPVLWRAQVQQDEAISFSTRPAELNNPDLGVDLDLLGVLWARTTRGPEGTFSLTTWNETAPEEGEPGGMVLETAGPMVPLDALTLPEVLFRASANGCPPPVAGR